MDGQTLPMDKLIEGHNVQFTESADRRSVVAICESLDLMVDCDTVICAEKKMIVAIQNELRRLEQEKVRNAPNGAVVPVANPAAVRMEHKTVQQAIDESIAAAYSTDVADPAKLAGEVFVESLRTLQTSELRCDEFQQAIDHAVKSLSYLKLRAARRKAQGVGSTDRHCSSDDPKVIREFKRTQAAAGLSPTEPIL